MKELFVKILATLVDNGKLNEAELYRSKEFAVFILETDDEKFKITISKE